jgi:predicted nuclease with RNAse H fold
MTYLWNVKPDEHRTEEGQTTVEVTRLDAPVGTVRRQHQRDRELEDHAIAGSAEAYPLMCD